ncbi:MAG: diguanylate cyclase [Eubacteriales bacterium]|nr:diguanylate cyclase [Eubacteriales bacterium]
MEEVVLKDNLTGLYNRNYLDRELDFYIDTANRYAEPFSMVLIDIDYFKRINDQHGHDIGDLVLIELAEIIKKSIRNSDRAFRWGGEEFLIVLPMTNQIGARHLADQLIQTIQNRNIGTIKSLTVSMGIAEHLRFEPKDIWFKRVDMSLYHAKNNGRNQIAEWEISDQLPMNLIKLDWHKQWECGNDLIDQEHIELVDMGNRLLDLTLTKASQTELKIHFDKLIDHLQIHFENEEKFLLHNQYTGYEVHRQQHQNIMNQFDTARLLLVQEALDPTALFNLMMGKFIFGHLMTADVEFFEFTRSKKNR